MLLFLQIALGVAVGEILFTLLTTTYLAYRSRGRKNELEEMFNQLQGLNLDQSAEVLDHDHAGV